MLVVNVPTGTLNSILSGLASSDHRSGAMEYLVAIEKGETVPPPISKSESLGFGQHNQRWQHAAQSN